jgi:hypothetical protein
MFPIGGTKKPDRPCAGFSGVLPNDKNTLAAKAFVCKKIHFSLISQLF